MEDNAFGDYALWLQLANDPSQTHESRELYRARMQEFVRARMRAAFQAAGTQRLRPSQEGNSSVP